MNNLKNFSEFYLITESKDYPLYKGISTRVIGLVLKDNKIKNDGTFVNKLKVPVIGQPNAISASRMLRTAIEYGSYIFEFDTTKLSSRYRIVPFCENPDYHLWYYRKVNKDETIDTLTKLKRNIRYKDGGKEFWKIKTDTKHDDWDICEELIVTDEIDITKYVKRIFVVNDYNIIKELKDFSEKYGVEIVVLNEENRKRFKIPKNKPKGTGTY